MSNYCLFCGATIDDLNVRVAASGQIATVDCDECDREYRLKVSVYA